MTKILVVTANPFEDWNFDADQEIRAIQEAADKAPETSNTVLRIEPCVKYLELATILARQTPDVLHLSVITFRDRGLYFDDARGKGRLPNEQIFRAEAYDNKVLPSVTFKDFANDLKRLRNRNLRCVILTSDMSEVDAESVANAIEGVAIGWPFGTNNKEALAFVRGFYQGLMLGRGMKIAYEYGIRTLTNSFPSIATTRHPMLIKCQTDINLDNFLAEEPISDSDGDESRKARDFLLNYFTVAELDHLCFDMNIDFESITGAEKTSKAINLIRYCRQRGKFQSLMKKARILRPDVKE